jgi:putative protease
MLRGKESQYRSQTIVLEVNMNKPELLAPAGNFEKMKAAIHYGADAVYLGISSLSLRAKADNFTETELEEAFHYAHTRGVKCYATINIFPHNRDIPPVRDHIQFLGCAQPDGVIVSDVGVFDLVKREAPHLSIHISTQANITNAESAMFWERMGARRLVLARELSFDEIARIRENVGLELECFVHGSICISYSGRCYMSAFMANRSANMGECAHPCRWNYTLVEEKRPGEFLPVYENDRGTYVMSSKDLCMVEHLDKLHRAGVNSFKIEGRTKGINYVAGVVKTYREAIDAFDTAGRYKVDDRWMAELRILSNRGYTTGMYIGDQNTTGYNHDEQNAYRMNHTLVGIVLERIEGKAKTLMRIRLYPGDKVIFLTSGLEDRSFDIVSIEDENRSPLDSARNDEIVWINVPEEVREGDLVRKPLS